MSKQSMKDAKQEWEYKIFAHRLEEQIPTIINNMNEVGKDNWELVSSTMININTLLLTFKRPKDNY